MSAKRLLMGAVLVASLAACSSVPYAQRMSNRQAAYAAAAGEPVRNFRFFELYSWEPLGNSQLAVYTRPNEAWLLTVSGPCPDLDFTNVIGLTSNLHEVSINFDKVLTGRADPPGGCGQAQGHRARAAQDRSCRASTRAREELIRGT
jgi:hypothetical protein